MSKEFSLGRNDRCGCGSNKKYKKCCLKLGIDFKHGVHELMVSIEDIIVGRWNHRQYGSDLIYTPSYKTLPENVVTEIENYINSIQVIKEGCWYNSFNLSVNVDGVDSVQGWYGRSMTEYYLSNGRKMIKEWKENGKIKQLINGVMDTRTNHWYEYDENLNHLFIQKDEKINYHYTTSQVYCLDLNTGIVWNRHSWNIYDDVHFDLTVEIQRLHEKDIMEKDSRFHNWTFYREVKRIDSSSFDDNEVLNSGWNKSFDKFKNKSLNEGKSQNRKMILSLRNKKNKKNN